MEEAQNIEELSNLEKNKLSEELFLSFLNDQKIPFVYVEQSFEKTSKEMRTEKIRRPDFIVYTKNFVFNIDVKYRKKQKFGPKNETRFYLNHEEIIELYNFQTKLNSIVWVAFTDLKTQEFFFAPISKIYEFYLYIKNEMEKKHSEIFEYFPLCFICIPDIFLYNRFSFENGFYNEPITGYLATEVEYHITNLVNTLRYRSI